MSSLLSVLSSLWKREGRLSSQGFQFEACQSPGSGFSHPCQMSCVAHGGEAALLGLCGNSFQINQGAFQEFAAHVEEGGKGMVSPL